MIVVILDAGDEVIDSHFEGSAEEILAAIPEGGRYVEVHDPVEEHTEEPPTPAEQLKYGVWNVLGYPSHVLEMSEAMAIQFFSGLPPGSHYKTLTGTAYENVLMAGELPAYADMEE